MEYEWIPFNAGDNVSENAVLGGYGPDLAPMYVVKFQVRRGQVSAYYVPRTNMAYFAYWNVAKSTTMEMLTIKIKHAWWYLHVQYLLGLMV